MDDSTQKKKGRQATKLKELSLKRHSGQKIEIAFDGFTGKPTGPYASKFNSYLGLLARSKVSILYEDWDHVPGDAKNTIWQDIMVFNFYCI